MTYESITGHFSIDGTALVALSLGVEVAQKEVFVIAPTQQIALATVERLSPPWAFTDGIAGRQIAIVARASLRPIDPAQAVDIGMRLARVCANQFASPTDWSAMQSHLERMVGISRGRQTSEHREKTSNRPDAEGVNQQRVADNTTISLGRFGGGR